MSIADICAALTEISVSAGGQQRRHQNHRHIAVQLYYVNGGHKSAYLWDTGPLCGQANAIQALLAALRSRRLIDGALCVCRLHSDVLVVNRRVLAAADLETVGFVDVTGGKAAVPRQVTNGERLLLDLRMECAAVRQQICIGDQMDYDNSDDFANVIDVQTNACVPMIFGWLIGYPICYWFAQQVDDNCLGGEPLSVFQLWHANAVRGDGCAGVGVAETETTVYSMSCAERLLVNDDDDCSGLAGRTEEWFKRRALESGLRFSVMRNVRLERVVL